MRNFLMLFLIVSLVCLAMILGSCEAQDPTQATEETTGTIDLVPNAKVMSTVCWTGGTQHAPPPSHTHGSGANVECKTYAAVKAFKVKWGIGSACNPNTVNVGSATLYTDYFDLFDYTGPSSVEVGDAILMGTSDCGASGFHAVVVMDKDLYNNIYVADANRNGNNTVLDSSPLATLSQVQSQTELDPCKVYRPKALEYPISTQPTLIYPPGSFSQVINTSQTFTWSAISGATSYLFEIDTLSNFSTKQTYYPSTNSISLTLIPGKSFHWRVKGYKSCGGYGPFSSTWIVGVAGQGDGAANLAMWFEENNSTECPGELRLDVELINIYADLTSIQLYKSYNGTSWSYVTTISTGQLPYTYETPEVTTENGIPVKPPAPSIYYQGRFYSGTQYAKSTRSTLYGECGGAIP